MKRLLIIAVLLVLALPLISFGCSGNPGPETSHQYEYTNFTNVQVGGAFEVEVIPSNTSSVEVTAPDNVFRYVKVEQSGSTLKIDADWGRIFWGWRIHSRPLVKIAMPEISVLDLSGACEASVKNFNSNGDFKLVLSGASTAEIDVEVYNTSVTLTGASKATGNFKGHDARLNLSGASTAQLGGRGNNLNIQASGASTADLSTLTANDVRVDLSGASKAKVLPNGELNVFLSGASRLEYGGNPKLGTVEVSGGSTLSRL
jgi:hypothetical protein